MLDVALAAANAPQPNTDEKATQLQARIDELEAGILEAATLVDGWHDGTRDQLLAFVGETADD